MGQQSNTLTTASTPTKCARGVNFERIRQATSILLEEAPPGLAGDCLPGAYMVPNVAGVTNQSNRPSRPRGDVGPCKRITTKQLPNQRHTPFKSLEWAAPTLKLTRVMVGIWLTMAIDAGDSGEKRMRGRPQRDGNANSPIVLNAAGHGDQRPD